MACASVALGSTLISLLSGCSPLPVYKTSAVNKIIEVDLINFKPDQNKLIVKCKGLDFDLLLVKKTDGTFSAIYMMCTHERQPLGTTSKGLFCSSHGSTFDLDGQVTQQPATKPLIKYVASIKNQKITINLSDQI